MSCCYSPTFDKIDLQKPNNEIWITIPGSVEKKRRDYDFLLRVAKCPDFPDFIRFVLLGNSSRFEGPKFIEEIRKNNLGDKFIWFEEFVPEKVFFNYMLNSDYLLPLIHPTTPSVKDYLKYKASGTFIQSVSYSIPMICHEVFNEPYFNFPSLFYLSEKDFLDIVNNIKSYDFKGRIQPPDFEMDKKLYCDFLFSTDH
ncbi:hypothetical protein [Thermophagus xiamenensis]|nr:hypothetical protein [Thermophagus xiamenensis]